MSRERAIRRFLFDVLVKDYTEESESLEFGVFVACTSLQLVSNPFRCLSKLIRLNSFRMGMCERVAFLTCKQLLTTEASKSFVQHGEKSSVQRDIAAFMAFESFYDALEQATSKVKHFWEQLKQEEFKVFMMHNEGIKMAASLKDMRRIKKQALNKNNERSKLKIYYMSAQFSLGVLDNELGAQKCYQQIRLIHSMNKAQKLDNEVNLDEEQGLIIISGSMAKLGVIHFANSSICMLLRHNRESLVGARVNSIVPHALEDNYHFLWKRFYRTGEAKFTERPQFTFLRTKKGHVVPVNMVAKFYNEGVYQDSFIGMVRLADQLAPFRGRDVPEEAHEHGNLIFLLAADTGRVLDCSSNATTMLGIQLNSSTRSDTVQDLSPQYDPVQLFSGSTSDSVFHEQFLPLGEIREQMLARTDLLSKISFNKKGSQDYYVYFYYCDHDL